MRSRAFSLERRILLLVLLPLIGAAIPATLMLWQAQKDLAEMRNLRALSDLVWKLGDLDACLDKESDNWYAFKPAWEATAEQRKAERVKQDQARAETDKAIAAYAQLRANVDVGHLSAPLRGAVDAVQKHIATLPDLRQTVYSQVDDSSSQPIIDGYRVFRQAVNQVLPLLVDATSNDEITRKLVVLPKFMLVRKAAMDSGGLIFYFHQLRAQKGRAFTPAEALTVKQGADEAEVHWADVIALSEGRVRERMVALHASPEWQRVIDLLRKHATSVLEGTPPPIKTEAEWNPSWDFLQLGLAAEIKALRDDFVQTCAATEQQTRRRRTWMLISSIGGAALVLWLARRLGRSISRPISSTATQLLADAETFTSEAATVRHPWGHLDPGY
jgi:hypothetical protein